MEKDFFFRNKNMSIILEGSLPGYDSLEDFEKDFPDDFLKDDSKTGDYLLYLLSKYDKAASAVSDKAGLSFSYVGLITSGKKNNPSRDALIAICLAMGTTFEEVQYLLKYAGQAPLYVRRKRDVVIWFGFMKGQDIETVDKNLYARGMKPLIKKD